jgi:hypothetical protein
MFRTTVRGALLAAAIAGPLLLNSPAQAATYDGVDPISSGCAATAITAETASIRNAAHTGVIGYIDLRYSTHCRTVWGRVRTTATDSATAGLTRNSDSAHEYCGPSTWSSDLGAYSCYTPMLNDANVTSSASGAIDEIYDGQSVVDEASTANY